MYKIIVIRPSDSTADARKIIMDEFYRGFLNNGCDATVIDLASPYLQSDLVKEFNKPVDFIFTFGNEPGYLFEVDDNPIVNLCNIPVVSYFVDPPYTLFDRLQKQINTHIILMHNQSYADNFFKTFLPNYQTKFVSLLYHGGSTCEVNFTEEQYSSRSNRIFFVGSYKALEDKKPWEIEPIPKLLREIMEEIYCCMADGSMDTDEAVLYVLKQRNLELADTILNDIFIYAFSRVHWYEYSSRRNHTLNCLIQNGFEIDFYGENWPETFKAKTNVQYNGPLHFSEMLKVISKYKLSLNPFHQNNCTHERTFNALANGCQSLLYGNKHYDKFFNGYKGLHYMDQEDFLNSVDRSVKAALYDTGFEELNKTRNYVLENHMWTNRSKQVLDFMELSKFSLKVN